MSIHGAGFDHRLYVLFAVLTHAMVGYVLVSVMPEPARFTGVVGAVLPDVDLLFAPAWSFPLVHRGLTHTPVFGAALVVAVGVWDSHQSGRRASSPYRQLRRPAAMTLGYGSHLVVDSFTASGVPWLYPVSTASYGLDLGIHGVEFSAILWLTFGTGYLVHRQRTSRH